MRRLTFSPVTAALIVVAFASLIAAGSTGLLRKHIPWHGDMVELALRLICLAVAVRLGWLIFDRLRNMLKARPAGAALDPPQPSTDRLIKLQGSVVEQLNGRFSNEAVAMFAKMIITPALYRTRVTENIDFEERIVTQRIAIEYALPMSDDSPARPQFVLLFAPPKGQIVDNLKITDGSGKPLTDLSFEESTELVAAGLRLLLQLAVQSGKRTNLFRRLGSALRQSERALELILLKSLTRRGVVNYAEVTDRIDRAFKRYQLDADAETVRELRSYVAALSVAYPIVAVVPKEAVIGGRAILRYERTLIPTALTKRGISSGRLRVLLGLKPSQVVVPVQLAATASSFHLYVNGPSNKYVLDQRFRCRICGQDVSRSWKPIDAPVGRCSHTEVPVPEGRWVTDVDRHYRVTPKLGQSFVHLYTRDFGGGPDPQFRDLELFARFKETPPGSRATAVVTALVSTFLLGIMGHLVSGRETPAASLPGLALALPAAAATWFGFATDGRSLVGSSMLARLSQIVTAVVSAVAIAVYFTSHHGHLPHRLSIVGVTEPVWVILLLISTANLLYVSYRFALKVQVYNGLLRRKERRGHPEAHSMKV